MSTIYYFIDADPSLLSTSSSTSTNSSTLQQARLEEWLQATIQKQSICKDRLVVYDVHKQSGLGNMIRGYFTAMAIGILTNRCVQGRIGWFEVFSL